MLALLAATHVARAARVLPAVQAKAGQMSGDRVLDARVGLAPCQGLLLVVEIPRAGRGDLLLKGLWFW